MKTEQINALLSALGEIRDRLPAPPETATGVAGSGGHYVSPTVEGPKPPPSPLATRLARAFLPLQNSERLVVRPGDTVVEITPATVTRMALQAVLETLDGWVEGAYENHGALDHRAEPVGDECWRRFHPADIRAMVNDAARQLGITEFPPVGVASARENTVCQ